MEEMNFTIVNNDGIEVKCDVLSIINDEEDKTYLLYTDYILNDNNEYNVYVSQFIKDEDNFILEEIDNLDLIPGFQEIYEDVKKQLAIHNW